jgi:hypothetical protein
MDYQNYFNKAQKAVKALSFLPGENNTGCVEII